MKTADPRPLVLTAPLSGHLLPIDLVPDPVFAQRMVGDGVSLDPTSQVLSAPCDGEILHVHSFGHALTLKTAGGIEVMMHIGLETVGLKGEGFTPKVRAGDKVKNGDPLIVFDADYVATHAKSLLTQIIITNGERMASVRPCSGSVTVGRDAVLEVVLSDEIVQVPAAEGEMVVSEPMRIVNAGGLHARPAALIAGLARGFACQLELRKGAATANAKSVVAIMGLNIMHDDAVVVTAHGADAHNAVDALTQLLRERIGEEEAPAEIRVAAPTSSRVEDGLFAGVSASPGVVLGNVVQVRREEMTVPERGGDPRREEQRLHAAISAAAGQIEVLRSRLSAAADGGKAAIFAAHEELLADPELLAQAVTGIAGGKSAAFAWREACMMHARKLEALNNELLAARANDVRDIGRRVLRLLLDVAPVAREYPLHSILIAEDLTPSETATLDRSRIVGFCTTTGGASSHVAILARSLGIPAVAGIHPTALDLPDGTVVILDGTKGLMRLNPSPDDVARLQRRQERLSSRRRGDLAMVLRPAVTLDGHRIEVAANISSVKEVDAAVAYGADGVGLLRTEFLFMDRSIPPTEDEQAEVYRSIATKLGKERPLIIRTLDVGGDKPLSYLPIPSEANPFLGERGIRAMLARPALLRTQLRAILCASAAGDVRVMFPMVGLLEEWREAHAILEDERVKLNLPPIRAGIMVEVPSAAVMAASFAREADFFSIGTNDLTQYTLAVDRGHPGLASKCDGLSPSILHLVAQTVRGAAEKGRWVGVCGGIAGDAAAIPFLIGLGVQELSVSVPALPAVRALVRQLRKADCTALAEKALTMGTAADVRGLLPADEE